eukprot:TRINITY_DN6650_c0_g1_i1.p3 TRINITY_DN6650_c0_g1~~TRINITY_DN6650_c0_g1_i1.p3  ORF type:complete len:233 (-),score=63.92 TRINITY_DN6650_c0_g1_i1:522-1220(-)
MLRHQEVGQIHKIRHRRIPHQQHHHKPVPPGLFHRDPPHIPLHIQRQRQQNRHRHRRHVHEQIHRVELLRLGSQQNPLHHRLQRPSGGGSDADKEPKEVEERLAVAGDDDAEYDGDEGEVDLGGLLLAGDEEGEDGGEERGGGADGLVEGDGEVAEGGVAADDGEAEDGGEGGDLEELAAGEDGLIRDELEPVDGDDAVDGAGQHVEHGEEDGVAVAVDAEEVFVEEKYPNV